ncbi:hypothetical protein EV176_002489 [Coemansia sp. RSA 451]|nr:hypothetical protein EV176_002489 [Coemansia sp. RSA 451]
MAHRDLSLAPISIPPSPNYPSTAPGSTPVLRPKSARAQVESGSARSGGLLGKMFRKGPPKHPKLNPVGISSKDYFASEPMSAPAQSEPRIAPKSAKLARKLSALSPPITQTSPPQLLTPQSAAVSAFPAATHGCVSDDDMDAVLSTPPVTADQLSYQPRQQCVQSTVPFSATDAGSDLGSDDAPSWRRRPSRLKLSPADAVPATDTVERLVRADSEDVLSAGDRKRRGSLWRAKLSFTNMRRPETRRQRHQSFDSNAVDIAAHPRLFPESPLVSLPAAAPVTAHGRSSTASGQLLADALLEAGIDISGPHSAAPGFGAYSGFDVVDDASGLGAIDRDFLLTIQRNSALEARRQRRRETRRSTMSFLAPSDARIAVPSPLPALANPHCMDSANSESHAGDKRSPPTQDLLQPAFLPFSAHADASQTAVSLTAAATPARSPKKPRPTSLDSLTFSEAQPAGSNRSARSSISEPMLGTLPSPQRVALSEIGEAAVKDSISRATRALSATRPDPAVHITRPLDVAVSGPQASTLVDTSVPPVPPLPRHIALLSPKQQPHDTPRPLDFGRPGTARSYNSPRVLADTRKYRDSTSAVPSSLRLTEKVPSSLNMALLMTASMDSSVDNNQNSHSYDSQTTRLQRYRMDSTSPNSNASQDPGAITNLGLSETSMLLPELANDYSLSHSVFARKFSHPEAQLQSSTSSPPVSSPDLLSKSATNLFTRMSVDSRSAPKDFASSANSKHGFSRLFSPSPPSRKVLPVTLSEPSHPTSPTIASLVGDPSARRKIRDQLASSKAFDRLLEEDDEFTMAISLTPTVAGSKS